MMRAHRSSSSSSSYQSRTNSRPTKRSLSRDWCASFFSRNKNAPAPSSQNTHTKTNTISFFLSTATRKKKQRKESKPASIDSIKHAPQTTKEKTRFGDDKDEEEEEEEDDGDDGISTPPEEKKTKRVWNVASSASHHPCRNAENDDEKTKNFRDQQQKQQHKHAGGAIKKEEKKNALNKKTGAAAAKKKGAALPEVDATAKTTTETKKKTTANANEEGHFEYTLGESLGPNNRFKILAPLGEGTFGKVLECYDRVKQEYCAVKVIRNVPKYKAAAKIEVEVLREIGKRDERDEFHCIRLKESFEHEGHACLMFDMYGLSLFDFMKKNHYKPFSLALVQRFAKQMIKAVAFMHELKMTHTDLKPENILLEAPGYVRVVSGDINANTNAANATATATSSCTTKVPVTSAIKLIDFGSTTLEHQYHSTVVSTRHYRAPEIILGTGWSYPCDMWSIGCILIELLTGDALFQTHENMEHLAMMRNVLGHMHADVIKRSSKEIIEKYFVPETYELRWPEKAKDLESERAVQAVQPLDIMIRTRFECEETGTLLRHLLSRLLEYDPDTRITAKDALNHGFFRLDIKENVYTPVTTFAGDPTSVANTANRTTDRTASSVMRNVAPTNNKARSQTTGGIRGSCLDKPSMATEIVLGA